MGRRLGDRVRTTLCVRLGPEERELLALLRERHGSNDSTVIRLALESLARKRIAKKAAP